MLTISNGWSSEACASLKFEFEPYELAVLVPCPEADRARSRDARQALASFGNRFAVVFVNQIGAVTSDDRLFRQAEHGADGVGHIANASLDIRYDNDIDDVFGEQTVTLLALLERPFKSRPIAELSG